MRTQYRNILTLMVFICIALIGENEAMNALAAKVNYDPVIVSNAIGELHSRYIFKPFSFTQFFLEYRDIIGNLIKGKPITTYLVGYGMAIFIAIFINRIGYKEVLTSAGSARWATIEELEHEKLLVNPYKSQLNGVIVGVMYYGINYETLYNFLSKIPFIKDRLFKVLNILKGLGVWGKKYIIDSAISNTHIIMSAPSRSGKGVGSLIPTLLTWLKSVIVFDLKGENLAVTGAFRKYILGQQVIAFAPTDTKPTYRFNPINEIRWGTIREGADVERIMRIIVGEPQSDKDKHWLDNAHALLVGSVIHLKYAHARYNYEHGFKPGDEGYIETSMYHIYEFLTTSFDEDGDPITFKQKLFDLLENVEHFPCHMYSYNKTSDLPMLLSIISTERAQEIFKFTEKSLKQPNKHPVVVNHFSSFVSKPDNEGGSVLSTAITAVSIFSEKIIADNTCTSDFIIGDIRRMEKPTSLYLLMPPSDVPRAGKLFKLIVEFILTVNLEDEAKSKQEHQCLLLLDEFPAFGNLNTFVTTLGYIASYGFKAFVVCQGLDQIQNIYKNLSILTNCVTQVFYAPKDKETPKLISEKLGKQTIKIKQKSISSSILGTLFGKRSYTYIEKERPLMYPDETIVAKDSIMILGEHKIRSPKNKYYIAEDMLEKLEAAKKHDPHNLVGLRY